MKPSDIRSQLLAEHASLRASIDDVRTLAAQVHGSETKRADLRMAMGRLVHALREHNVHEEEIVRELWSNDDAGAARRERLDGEHKAEHRELTDAFVDATSVFDAALANGVFASVLDRLLGHMAREEETVLGDQASS